MSDQINSGANNHSEIDMVNAIREFMDLNETKKRITNLMGRGSRLNVNIDEIRNFNPRLANFITRNPIASIKAFEDELNSRLRDLQGGSAKNQEKTANQTDSSFPTKVKHYYINFEGNIGKNYVTPRGLKSHLVNKLVKVQGIVTKMSIVQPKI